VVAAVNSAGEAVSTSASARTGSLLPSAPAALVAVGITNAIQLSWTSDGKATSFLVKRSLTQDNFQLIASGITSSGYVDSNVVAGTTYYYVVSGLNQGGESAASAMASATPPIVPAAHVSFLGVNTSRRGNWKGAIGVDGYQVIGDSQLIPNYATLSATGKTDWTWNSKTTETRALQRANSNGRIAACWYASTSFDMDVNVNDPAGRKVSLYFLDWDKAGRVQTVEVIDKATGLVLNTQSLSSFGNGVYLEYKLQGRVTIRVKRTLSANAVINGIFFDPLQ
jgi:hypothetical protein